MFPFWRSRAKTERPRTTKPHNLHTRLRVEQMEDRVVPDGVPVTAPPPVPVTALVVTTIQDVVNPNDDNVNFSLREAIASVNPAVAGSYKITFAPNIMGQTITLDTAIR